MVAASEVEVRDGLGDLPLGLWFRCVPVVGNRWIDRRWEVAGLVLGEAPETAAADAPLVYRQAPSLSLYGDEAEGYILNVDADQPSLFCMLRAPEDGDPAVAPDVIAVTASFYEAARWADAGEQVERLPLPAGWEEAIREFAQARLKPPEEKKPKRRYAEHGDKRDRPGH